MRVLVCGTPGWDDPTAVKMVLSSYMPDEVVFNDSLDGVDAQAAEWCAENAVSATVVPVDGTKGATAVQNNIEEMLSLLNVSADRVLSFTVMDPANPNYPGPLLAHDMAFEAGFGIDYTVLEPMVFPFEDDLRLPCALCGLELHQLFDGEELPHWADENGDAVCTASTEARPDHIPILPA